MEQLLRTAAVALVQPELEHFQCQESERLQPCSSRTTQELRMKHCHRVERSWATVILRLH
jgi:hypothetical protein